jgi:hypothetical protein
MDVEGSSRKYLDEARRQFGPGETLVAAASVSFGLKPGVLALTQERIIICHARTSALGVRRAEMRLADVQSVDFAKGSIRDGTRNQVTIASASGHLGPLADDEAEGRRWVELALGQLERVNQSHAPRPTGDLAQQLTQLAALHDRGALSDAEFEAAKSKLLGVS